MSCSVLFIRANSVGLCLSKSSTRSEVSEKEANLPSLPKPSLNMSLIIPLPDSIFPVVTALVILPILASVLSIKSAAVSNVSLIPPPTIFRPVVAGCTTIEAIRVASTFLKNFQSIEVPTAALSAFEGFKISFICSPRTPFIILPILPSVLSTVPASE